MAFNFFGFGRTRKYRKSSRKSAARRKTSKAVPPKLRKICKRYGVKVGKKSVKQLKKQCAKVIRRRIKAILKKKKTTTTRRKSYRRRSRFGAGRVARRRSSMVMMPPVTRRGIFRRAAHRVYKHRGRYARGGLKGAGLLAALYGTSVAGRAARRKYKGQDMDVRGMVGGDIGRARAGAGYVGSGAQSAGRSAYLSARHPGMVLSRMRGQTVFGKRRRRYGFGNGGNPPLMASTGYEFCSNGGGVLGANSTGLFPTPCMGAAPKAAFGRRRTTRRRVSRRRVSRRRASRRM